MDLASFSEDASSSPPKRTEWPLRNSSKLFDNMACSHMLCCAVGWCRRRWCTCERGDSWGFLSTLDEVCAWGSRLDLKYPLPVLSSLFISWNDKCILRIFVQFKSKGQDLIQYMQTTLSQRAHWTRTHTQQHNKCKPNRGTTIWVYYWHIELIAKCIWVFHLGIGLWATKTLSDYQLNSCTNESPKFQSKPDSITSA